ncbi:MAG TPA: aminopeptidase P N-terminal domain-containing protein, partial [Gemmatimonadaceae bacterium]|nr:aminopeptidase P N-terminal domain-containing protein [Gemmatimonadaceae bacterium]
MRRRLLIAALLAPAIAARAQVPREEYAARRAALAARLPDSAVLIALGAREPREDYVTFVQAPDFWYLTGFLEADADLLLVKRGARVSATMFVLPRDLAIEMWTGPRAGLDSAAARTGLATQRVGEFRSALDSAIAGAKSIYVVGDLDAGAALSADDQFVASLEREHPGLIIVNAAVIVDSLRSRKSAAELALLRRAIGITVRAESAALRTVAPDLPEY